ncbi:hypothetical protein BGZ46_008099 [Entomortierella lignicola]|nr:hypothetical protein BGZ46_008099 [Entomortierella lignicola]
MTSVASPQPIARPHVKVERSRATPTRENSRSTNVVSPSPQSSTVPAKPSLPTNKRYSNVQSKVGSLEAISYKPKPSEKKIQSFKQDFSHVKSKVDAKLAFPVVAEGSEEGTPSSDSASETPTANSKPSKAATAPVRRPFVVSTAISRTPSTSSLVKTTGAISVVNTNSNTSTTLTPTHSRRNSSSSAAGSVTSSTTLARRMSKHIIPTQKANYDNVKSKVGSFDNISFVGRGRTSSRSSSADDGDGRSRSPSALSSTSSTGPSSPSRRSSFKIPPSKKVDYSNVKSKVGSLENANHVPQGGNLRIFSEKLTFRDQAQSKIAKEINIAQFYDYSLENSIQEEQEEEEGEEEEEELEPPKNILSALDEVAESVGGLELEEQEQQQEQQANNSHGTHSEPIAAL